MKYEPVRLDKPVPVTFNIDELPSWEPHISVDGDRYVDDEEEIIDPKQINIGSKIVMTHAERQEMRQKLLTEQGMNEIAPPELVERARKALRAAKKSQQNCDLGVDSVLKQLRDRFPGISPHIYAEGENDDSMFSWFNEKHYLEIEIFKNGAIEVFYRNKETGFVWSEDTTLEQGFSNQVFEYLGLFYG